MWSEVLERFEQHAPVGVMARVALEQALPATWIDEVFEASRQRQYPRELMMSTVVELMMLVSLGLPPSLHAASKKRLAPLRGERGAAPPGHTLVVYDPDQALVTDIVACEDAHESERTVARTLVASAGAGELWLADSHFCTRALLQGWQQAGAAFIVREHGRHPRLVHQLVLDEPTREGLTQLNLWSNLPPQVIAEQIANLYRRRWRIEGLFGRIESVLHSEIRTLGHPRAALLGFATAVLAYNVFSLLKRCIEQAHREQIPELDVSTYHLAVDVTSDYKGMLIALPPSAWGAWSQASAERTTDYLLRLARLVCPRSVATSKRGSKKPKPKGYVEAAAVRKHVSTARVLQGVKGETP